MVQAIGFQIPRSSKRPKLAANRRRLDDALSIAGQQGF